MIFRLEYCNKASVTARVDIQKGDATPIYTVEGTSEPFVLFYNNDKGDKSGSFRSSGADINIYETTEFNIDELKTSNETEISVKYYINNILNWSGFVIPDFFSETITGGQGVVSMVASDRLGTLKGATLSELSAKVSNRLLADACLAQTGLSLPLYTMADFTGDGTNIFNSEVLSQRMVDTKGRNVSCYDILSSILEETNSLIVQRNGAWYIVNKLQLEAGSGSLYNSPVTSSEWVDNTVNFSNVSVGARRTITPVAAAVGVYHEHGGGRLHPDNYDFSGGNTGWVASGGFPFTIATNQIVGYTRVNNKWTVDFGDTDKSRMQINKIYEGPSSNTDLIAYVSNTFPIISASEDNVKVEIDISVTGMPTTTARAIILADNGTTKFAFNPSQGAFEPYDPQRFDGGSHSVFFVELKPEGEYLGNEKYDSATKSLKYSAVLNATDVQGYNISIRFYGTDSYNGSVIPIFVNFASIKFSNTAELPKGNIFKTTQGANYTKDHDIPTVLWGDYLTSGLNGYFYDYPIDDTSSLYRPTGELHSRWTAYGDPDTLPLLQHITRQKARMFSVAHDLLSADIATSAFDPLSIFVSCEGTSDETRYVVVSARFDFLRSNVSVELEEVAYVTNSKRDYIYSYFGDGEEGISSIGGITGGTAGGAVSHSHANKGVIDQLTQQNIDLLSYLSLYQTGVQQTQLLDEFGDPVFDLNGDPVMIDVLVPVLDSFGNPVLDINGDPVMETVPVYAIKSTASFFSEKEVSAFGLGDSGSGGGGFDMLLAWDNYSPEKSQWVISAALGKGLMDRIVLLEDGGSGGSNVSWGTESGGYIPLTVESVSKSVALSTHDHSGVYAPVTHDHSGVYAPVTHDHSGVYAPVTHDHSGVYEPVFSKNTAFNKNFGITSGTVAQGNDSRIVNGQTAYSWGNHASAGYALSSALANYVTLATSQTISGAKTFSAALTASVSVTTPKVIFAAAGWSLEQVGTELQMKHNGVVKQRMLSDGSIVATGEVTAFVAAT